MTEASKNKKTSVFVCTNDELIDALRRKQKLTGLANAIIEGCDGTEQGIDNYYMKSTKEDMSKMIANMQLQPGDTERKKSVHFTLPKGKAA